MKLKPDDPSTVEVPRALDDGALLGLRITNVSFSENLADLNETTAIGISTIAYGENGGRLSCKRETGTLARLIPLVVRWPFSWMSSFFSDRHKERKCHRQS